MAQTDPEARRGGHGAQARARRQAAGEGAGAPRAWWARAREALSRSAWTALGGKTAAYVAGFFALALVGSGDAMRLLPGPAGGEAETALVLGALAGQHPPGNARDTRARDTRAKDAPDAGATDGGGRTETDADATDGGAGGGVTADGKIVLNLATADDLRRLPGIGPARAAAILALRARLKRFRRVEDLRRVKGIGRRSLARLRPLVVVDPP